MGSIDGSSSSASDRSSSTDDVRRVREAYQQKEADEAKKQGQQIRRLTEAHEAEIDDLKQEHTREIDDMKVKTRELIGRRDMEYQKEIEDLRDMHQKQVTRLASEAQERLGRTETTLKDQIKQSDTIDQDQKRIMRTSYEDELRNKDSALEEFSARSRDTQQKAIRTQGDQMNKSSDEKVRLLSQDRDERLADKQRTIDVDRRARDQETKRVAHQRQLDTDRLNSEHAATLSEVQENSHQQWQEQRDGFQHDIKETRDKYSMDGERRRAEMDKAREELTDSVVKRTDDEVNVLRAKGTRLEGDQVRQRVSMERQKQRELTDLRDSMQSNLDRSEQVRQDTQDMAIRRTHLDVYNLNKLNEKSLHDQNQFYQDKIALDTLRNSERFDNTKVENQRLLNQEKNAGENRASKLRSSNDIEQNKMRNYFDRASSQMKENFDTSLRDIRDRNKQDQDGLFAQFTKQAQDSDAKFQQKLMDTSNKYDHQIAQLQEDRLKDLKDQKTTSDRQHNEFTKKSDTELKTQASQYEYRLGKIDEQHRKEIDEIQRKHEESLANLTANSNKIRQA